MDISRPCQPDKLIPLLPEQDSIPVFQDTMLDEQSSASGHDYAQPGFISHYALDCICLHQYNITIEITKIEYFTFVLN